MWSPCSKFLHTFQPYLEYLYASENVADNSVHFIYHLISWAGIYVTYSRWIRFLSDIIIDSSKLDYTLHTILISEMCKKVKSENKELRFSRLEYSGHPSIMQDINNFCSLVESTRLWTCCSSALHRPRTGLWLRYGAPGLLLMPGSRPGKHSTVSEVRHLERLIKLYDSSFRKLSFM